VEISSCIYDLYISLQDSFQNSSISSTFKEPVFFIMASSTAPSSILIIGSGVFGLSTALALAKRPPYSSAKITVLDRSQFPSLDGSSIDTSRIVRAGKPINHSNPPNYALYTKKNLTYFQITVTLHMPVLPPQLSTSGAQLLASMITTRKVDWY
jgi:hypothetical protein